jgi:hypothetical protein
MESLKRKNFSSGAPLEDKPIEEFLEKNLDRRHNAVGNPAYPALGMFKALLLQSWYDLSDRELSDNLEDRISFSHFCGFSLDHEVPDYSTSTDYAPISLDQIELAFQKWRNNEVYAQTSNSHPGGFFEPEATALKGSVFQNIANHRRGTTGKCNG